MTINKFNIIQPMNKITITTLATAVAAVTTLAYGQLDNKNGRYEVFETKVVANTSDIKEVSVKLEGKITDPQGSGKQIAAVKVPYRAPIKKTYTILVAYDHGDPTDLTPAGEPKSYGRMWAGDKRQAVKVRALTDDELADLREDGNIVPDVAGVDPEPLNPRVYDKVTYDGGVTSDNNASPIGQKGLDHPYFGVFVVTDASPLIEHAVPKDAVIELRGLATHRKVKSKTNKWDAKATGPNPYNIQYVGMAARARAAGQNDHTPATAHEEESVNTITGVAFGEGFYPVRPLVKGTKTFATEMHMEQGLGHNKELITDNNDLTDAHLAELPDAATNPVKSNNYDIVYTEAGNAFMPKANLLPGGTALNPAHFHGTFTTKRNDAALKQKIDANGKNEPANWDQLIKVIDFRVPKAQQWPTL